MLTLIGLLIIISIVVLLMTGKTSPVIAMSVIPLLGALLAGYSLPEITEFLITASKSGQCRSDVPVCHSVFQHYERSAHLQSVYPPDDRADGKCGHCGDGYCAGGSRCASRRFRCGNVSDYYPGVLPIYRRLGMSPYLMLLLMCMSMG